MRAPALIWSIDRSIDLYSYCADREMTGPAGRPAGPGIQIGYGGIQNARMRAVVLSESYRPITA
jgi:hypothetical protein